MNVSFSRALGRPRVHCLREIRNASLNMSPRWVCLALAATPVSPWKTVLHYFRTRRVEGTWEKLRANLRTHLLRRLPISLPHATTSVAVAGEACQTLVSADNLTAHIRRVVTCEVRSR